jgi:hypothetical protein
MVCSPNGREKAQIYVLENKVLRIIFEHKGQEILGLRKLYNEELQ